MGAELKKTSKNVYWIDGKNSQLMARIQEKCETCPLKLRNPNNRSKPCLGMSSMNAMAVMIRDITPEQVKLVQEEAPCLDR